MTSQRSWVLEGIGADGKPARMEGQSAEVARRQPDGTWLFVIDNPYGLQLAADECVERPGSGMAGWPSRLYC